MKYTSLWSSWDTIQMYEKQDDKIIITYLNGFKQEEKLEKEQEILDKMLEQATKRNEIYDKDYIDYQKNYNLTWMWIEGCWILTNSINCINTDIPFNKVLTGVAATICALGEGLFLTNYLKNKKIADELTKYDIYLSIKDELEKFKYSNNRIEDITDLNINTLDNYSLKQIKKIRKHIS